MWLFNSRFCWYVATIASVIAMLTMANVAYPEVGVAIGLGVYCAIITTNAIIYHHTLPHPVQVPLPKTVFILLNVIPDMFWIMMTYWFCFLFFNTEQATGIGICLYIYLVVKGGNITAPGNIRTLL